MTISNSITTVNALPSDVIVAGLASLGLDGCTWGARGIMWDEFSQRWIRENWGDAETVEGPDGILAIVGYGVRLHSAHAEYEEDLDTHYRE